MAEVSALDKIIAGITKRYPGTFENDIDRNPKRISTGSLELDRATGGGIPMGRFTRIWGNYSTGKSLTAWNIARSAQAMGMNVAYYNVENIFDADYVETQRGIDISYPNLIIVNGEIIEQIGVKLEALLPEVNLHIIDSLSSAIPLGQLEAPLENNMRLGMSAVAWQKVLQLITSRMTNDNAVILIDQARDIMNYQGHGAGEHPPGGKYIEHSSSLTIYFTKGKWLFYDKDGFLTDDKVTSDTLSGMTEADGIEISAKIMKTKVCKPFRTAKMYLDFNTNDFDTTFELEKAARFFNVVDSAHSWYTLADGTKLQGRKNLRKAIEENKDLRETIIERLREDQ